MFICRFPHRNRFFFTTFISEVSEQTVLGHTAYFKFSRFCWCHNNLPGPCSLSEYHRSSPSKLSNCLMDNQTPEMGEQSSLDKTPHTHYSLLHRISPCLHMQVHDIDVEWRYQGSIFNIGWDSQLSYQVK